MSEERIQPGRIVSVAPHSNRVTFSCEHGCGSVDGVSPRTIRLRYSTADELLPRRSYAIETPIPHHVVSLKQNDSHATISTANASLSLDKTALAVSLHDRAGHVLSQGLPVECTDKGVADHRRARADEDFFGLGEKITPLGRRGYLLENWNSDDPSTMVEGRPRMYDSFPFMIGIDTTTGRCWGYFLDSPYRSTFIIGRNEWDRVAVSLQHSELDIYFITGDHIAELLEEYTALTGRHAMPPLWTLGYHQCRWSYMSTDNVRDITSNLRSRRIPCDGIWFDIDYMDGFRVFTFDNDRFADVVDLTTQLKQQGFRCVAIVDPGVKVDEPGVYDVYDEGVREGHFIRTPGGEVYHGKVWPGGTAFPDFTDPKARAWWGSLHRRYYEAGIDAFWNDMNEPADHAGSDNTMPSENMCRDGVSMAEVHNVYGLLEAKSTVEDGMLALRPNDRPFVLTRAAHAGTQKYAAKWGGDNRSTWTDLKNSVVQLVNMGLSGLGFYGCDVGGFGGNCTPELLVRWTQLGAFYPFFRNHSAIGTRNQEPWTFGPEVEQACREAIERRYHLLPCFYQLFHEMHTTGAPVARPLFWHYPTDRRTYSCIDQFMLGRYLVVAPIVERGARSRLVYLPDGDWYHYETGERYTGNRECVVEAPLDSTPLFVRAGSVLPVMPVVQSTADIDTTTLTLEVFPGECGLAEKLYEDDGVSNAYRTGAFRLSDIAYREGVLSVRLAEDSVYGRVVVRVFDKGRFSETAHEGKPQVRQAVAIAESDAGSMERAG
ncbi:MAG: DUF4968 domain-containing protein [Chitinivibrionales bacterium]|nr:DUF4968 domain-containing protein [Chitinivibrionales bacterium]